MLWVIITVLETTTAQEMIKATAVWDKETMALDLDKDMAMEIHLVKETEMEMAIIRAMDKMVEAMEDSMDKTKVRMVTIMAKEVLEQEAKTMEQEIEVQVQEDVAKADMIKVLEVEAKIEEAKTTLGLVVKTMVKAVKVKTKT